MKRGCRSWASCPRASRNRSQNWPEGSPLTRQAITKHLRVLEGARLVGSVRVGRESLYALRPEPLKEIQSYLERVSEQWDHALARLKSFVEE